MAKITRSGGAQAFAGYRHESQGGNREKARILKTSPGPQGRQLSRGEHAASCGSS